MEKYINNLDLSLINVIERINSLQINIIFDFDITFEQKMV